MQTQQCASHHNNKWTRTKKCYKIQQSTFQKCPIIVKSATKITRNNQIWYPSSVSRQTPVVGSGRDVFWPSSGLAEWACCLYHSGQAGTPLSASGRTGQLPSHWPVAHLQQSDTPRDTFRQLARYDSAVINCYWYWTLQQE